MATPAKAAAFSYLRFSSAQQAAGDSIRRQTANREAWLKDHPNARLDTSLVMTDAGRSAFRRKNWDTYALAEFVGHIKTGRVEPGSYLLVENLDRLSREDAGEATELFLSIVNRGIVVVQLMPVVMEFRRPVNVQSLMFAIVELSRGHSESAVKSERVGAAWRQKKLRAAERPLSRRLPGWVRVAGDDPAAPRDRRRPIRDGDKLALDPDKAAVVRRVFDLALAGSGAWTIARTLNAENVPVLGRTTYMGRAVRWSVSIVYHLLTSRAVLGEYQPKAGPGTGWSRKPDGEPVRDYYPRVVGDEDFYAVQEQLRTRGKVGRGRRGRHVNLFGGLLRDARDGGAFTYRHHPRHATVLQPVGAKAEGNAAWTTFNADYFDAAVLDALREVRAADVCPDRGGATRRAEAAAAKLAETEGLIARWRAKMDVPELVDTVAEKLAALEARRRAEAADLAQARRQAASPLAESWGEFRSLGELLAGDGGAELRERARSALRRVVDSVWLVILKGEPGGSGRTRVCVAQVRFKGEARAHREYVITYRQPVWNGVARRTGKWWVRSLPPPGVAELDLRKPAHARRVERFLAAAAVPPVPAGPGRPAR